MIKTGACLWTGWVIVWSKDGGRRTRVHGNSRDRDTEAGSCPDRQRWFPHVAQESAEVLGKMGMSADFL